MLAKLFQFTPPCRGRHLRGWIIWILKNFNSRPRVGGDILQGHVVPGGWHISIPAPVWGRRPGCYPCALSQYFNSRPRVGGDLAGRVHHYTDEVFQFPPPCGGRPAIGAELLPKELISIHAPMWGATLKTGEGSPDIEIFQFTPPCGGRPDVVLFTDRRIVISIHAPVWGATPGHCGQLQHQRISIHAPVWGATSGQSPCNPAKRFQFTPPCGGRPPGLFHRIRLMDISIHAPVWGATVECKCTTVGKRFQFPPPCGGRQQIYTKINCCKYAK